MSEEYHGASMRFAPTAMEGILEEKTVLPATIEEENSVAVNAGEDKPTKE